MTPAGEVGSQSTPLPGRRLSWRRRLLFNALMLVGIWLSIEVTAYVVMPFNLGPMSQLAEQRKAAANQDPYNPGGQFTAPGVLHPYVGAVMQPRNDDERRFNGKFRVTEFGFVDEGSPIHKRSPEQLIIGILGGSVARQLSLNATDVIAEELAKSPEFVGKKFQFVRLASNGYKQPQQLMIINYMIALGAEFDILINLDGFNEATLPEVDNVPFGVNVTFPRDWGKLIAGTASPEFVKMGGVVAHMRQLQRDDARWFSRSPWQYSPTATLIWAIGQQRSNQAISLQLSEMTKFTETERTYCGSGPPETFASTEQIYDHCIGIWSRCSVALHQLCDAQGIRYFHFLQPNQYLQGSKPIGSEEAAVAVNESIQSCRAVRACFPKMQAEGARLADQGIRFTDLTRVFAEHPEPIYVDTCCHVVEAGDILMARAIAARIRSKP